MMDITDLRDDYCMDSLGRSDLNACPFEQFEIWFAQALRAKVPEPNAMILATASAEGSPSSRTLLLKGFGKEGFIFYTNYGSQKAQDIDANPRASMTFLWLPVARQVHLRGSVERLSEEESLAYFSSRPRKSQLAAWASKQDTAIASRAILDTAYAKVEQRFEGKEVSKPPYWGGYRLHASEFEFWQGRPSRLHDRFVYRQKEGEWGLERLMP
jgi:pyridoxamine 5'-phosphate oxidase